MAVNLEKELTEWRDKSYRQAALIRRLSSEGERYRGVVAAVVKLGKDCRYDVNDWVLSPELAQKYVESVYQQALAALVSEGQKPNTLDESLKEQINHGLYPDDNSD